MGKNIASKKNLLAHRFIKIGFMDFYNEYHGDERWNGYSQNIIKNTFDLNNIHSIDPERVFPLIWKIFKQNFNFQY